MDDVTEKTVILHPAPAHTGGRLRRGTHTLRTSITTIFKYMKVNEEKDIGSFISPSNGDAASDSGDDEYRLDTPFQQLAPYFTIGDKLDMGGFCDIYIAKDNSLHRKVVIKTLHEDKNGKYSERNAFLLEAKITASLSHPNIVPIYGVYTDESRNLYLVMKWIQGKKLKEHIANTVNAYKVLKHREIMYNERRQLLERLDIFLKVCDAVAYAHHRGVLHRDLKPDNIMLGEFSEIYVMDWGISEYRNINTISKISRHVAGTISYLSPEILGGESYDSRADIYSLGVILFELAFLRPAFFPDEKLAENIVRGSAVPPRHLFHYRVPAELKRIIAKAMNRVPEKRYQTVALLIDDLHRYLRGVSQVWWKRLLR